MTTTKLTLTTAQSSFFKKEAARGLEAVAHVAAVVGANAPMTANAVATAMAETFPGLSRGYFNNLASLAKEACGLLGCEAGQLSEAFKAAKYKTLSDLWSGLGRNPKNGQKIKADGKTGDGDGDGKTDGDGDGKADGKTGGVPGIPVAPVAEIIAAVNGGTMTLEEGMVAIAAMVGATLTLPAKGKGRLKAAA